jgi:hypothetical protein
MDPVVMSSLDKAQLRELIQRRLSYRRQFWALLAKTAIAQRRDSATNACQVLTPIILVPRTVPSSTFRPSRSSRLLLTCWCCMCRW